jgi:ribosomal protein S18 acetylase RimI-like enzyme
MAELRIRTASVDDINAIGLLCGQLYEDMAILRPDCFTARQMDDKILYEAIVDGKQEILVATAYETVVGFVRVAERETPSAGPMLPRKHAFIPDIAVDPAFRGLDIGSALINEAKNWAKDRSLEYVEIGVLSDSEGAVRLLQRENFETVVQTMRCRIVN